MLVLLAVYGEQSGMPRVHKQKVGGKEFWWINYSADLSTYGKGDLTKMVIAAHEFSIGICIESGSTSNRRKCARVVFWPLDMVPKQMTFDEVFISRNLK